VRLRKYVGGPRRGCRRDRTPAKKRRYVSSALARPPVTSRYCCRTWTSAGRPVVGPRRDRIALLGVAQFRSARGVAIDEDIVERVIAEHRNEQRTARPVDCRTRARTASPARPVAPTTRPGSSPGAPRRGDWARCRRQGRAQPDRNALTRRIERFGATELRIHPGRIDHVVAMDRSGRRGEQWCAGRSA